MEVLLEVHILTDRIETILNKDLDMSVRDFLVSLDGSTHPNVGWGPGLRQKEKLSMSVHCPLLPDCGHNVAGDFPAAGPSLLDGWYPQEP